VYVLAPGKRGGSTYADVTAMMKMSIALVVVLALVLVGCKNGGNDPKPVYYDYPLAGVPA
jgi:hypothetical protein